MTTTDKLQGTCSVCLREMQIRGDHPIRHGFSAVGVRHGQHSGWHTGPCGGTGFPHLGISPEGTRWALGHAQQRLVQVNQQLAELATRPALIWYPRLRSSFRKGGGLPDMSNEVTLRPGEDVLYSPDGRPTYDVEHRRRVAEQTNIKGALEAEIKTYEKVLATWTPEKYPVTGAAKKVEIVHMATPRKNVRFGEWTGILCRFTRPGYASDKNSKTADPSKVTCKKCRKSLGLPPL